MAIFKGKAGFTDSAPAGEQDIGVVLNSTCFYAEAGGQVFDTGVLTLDGVRMDVLECKKFGAYVLHIGRIVKGQSLTLVQLRSCSSGLRRLSSFMSPFVLWQPHLSSFHCVLLSSASI